MIVGITGGIGSGKSTIAEALVKLAPFPIELINADAIVHNEMTDASVIQQIRDRWGSWVAGGSVNRKNLAHIVFKYPSEMRVLEGILHPRVRTEIHNRITFAANNDNIRVIIDAPLLFEYGLNSLCNKTIFVNVSPETQKKRVVTRGWTEQDLIERSQLQWPLEIKRSQASIIVENDCDGVDQEVCRQIVKQVFENDHG